MFSTSTQKNYWNFSGVEKLNELRAEQNKLFIEKYGSNMTDEECSTYFLSPAEESLLLKKYEIYLMDFCRRFDPPMPKCAMGTAFHYFKRFYLKNTPMDYHPKEILATCVYLACKVEEFNVSINQFVGNTLGDRGKATNVILSYEPLLMQALNYQLTIHNPFRPIEGFLIDIKTNTKMKNAEMLRKHIDDFLDQTHFTDSCLLYPPSQIALAAVLHAASIEKMYMDGYVTEHLFRGAREKIPNLIEAVRKIRLMVKQFEVPSREKVKLIEKKLELCRNQENNPETEIYKERLRRIWDEDDDFPMANQTLADSSAEMIELGDSI